MQILGHWLGVESLLLSPVTVLITKAPTTKRRPQLGNSLSFLWSSFLYFLCSETLMENPLGDFMRVTVEEPVSTGLLP